MSKMPITIRLKPTMIERLDKFAKDRGLTRTDIVEMGLDRFLAAKGYESRAIHEIEREADIEMLKA